MRTFTVFLCLSVATSLVGESFNLPNKVMESFEDGIPVGLSSTGRSLGLDKDRMKHGQQSLKWQWRGNDRIVFDTPIGYRKQRRLAGSEAALEHTDPNAGIVYEPPRGFFMWVYNTEASAQRLRIQFGRGEEVDCWFDFNLNFKGWRTIALNYDWGNMRGAAREDMTRMTINAPNTGTGVLYFDNVGFSVPMNPRTVGPNPQLPEIHQHPRLVPQYPHLLYEYSKYKPSFNLEPLSADQLKDFRAMEKRAMKFWHDEPMAVDMERIREKFGQFEIRRERDAIYGRPLANKNTVLEYFSERNISRKEAQGEFLDWRYAFGGTLLTLARAWNSTDDPAEKKELAEMFIDLFDYGQDQGFAPGAGLGWLHHYSYIIREYAPSMLLMRSVLKETGRLGLAVETCKWFYGVGQVYREDLVYGWKNRKSANADEMQGILTQRLISALLMEDSPQKARDIKHFSSYFSNVTTAYSNALDETFKPDGTIFHHAGHAYGYGGRAIMGGVRTFKILEGTVFAASDESRQRLLKVTRTYYDGLFTERLAIPKVFASIRFESYELPDQFRGMLEMLGERYEPLDGFMMLPYSCVGLRRKADDWMIASRAHSKYVYPFESWGKSFFAFPLFIGNGYLDVSYPESIDSLTPDGKNWSDGVDWRRFPGTTSVRLPFDEMATRVGQVRDEGGEYLFSDQAFSGGVESSYGVGIQVFQFKGHDKYGLESFTGKKTWFFVGNKVLCLGTDIQSGVAGRPVETTLFQTALDAKGDAIVVDGERVTDFPYEKRIGGGKAHWLIDSRGTGYYVPSGELNVLRSRQVNPDANDTGDSSGDFATAWFDHGIQTKYGEYEYVLFADADEGAIERYAQSPSLEVLQKDSAAHVVELKEENATAFAVYAEEGARFESGVVRGVSKQATLLAKEEGGRLRLTVADPDLNIYDGQEDLMPDGTRAELSVYEREWFFWPSRETTLQVELNGLWEVDEIVVPMETADRQARVVARSERATVVEFICRDGLSTEILLSR